MKPLDERMKMYESVESSRRSMPFVPTIARLDGQRFNKFTEHLKKPYCEELGSLMQETALKVMIRTNAVAAYTQSDEISLLFYSGKDNDEIFHGGKTQKIVSSLASETSVLFNKGLPIKIPSYNRDPVIFDCMVWQIPTKIEIYNYFYWSQEHAIRNSVSTAARSYFSHHLLINKNKLQMIKMLKERNPPVIWEDYPKHFKKGTFFQRRRIVKEYTDEEIKRLPEKHNARKEPCIKTEINEYRMLDIKSFSGLKDKVDIIFNGASPKEN